MKRHAMLGLFLACATCAGLALAAETPAIWIDVPFVAQSKDGCGSAAISMLLRYWEGKERPPRRASADLEAIQASLVSKAQRGISASKMQGYFQESGYRTYAFQGEWSDLQHHLEQGRPLIAALKASGPMEPLHYVVVVGMDSQRNYLFVNDPARQKMLRISREGFQAEWRSTHNWTLLVVPQAGD